MCTRLKVKVTKMAMDKCIHGYRLRVQQQLHLRRRRRHSIHKNSRNTLLIIIRKHFFLRISTYSIILIKLLEASYKDFNTWAKFFTVLAKNADHVILIGKNVKKWLLFPVLYQLTSFQVSLVSSWKEFNIFMENLRTSYFNVKLDLFYWIFIFYF